MAIDPNLLIIKTVQELGTDNDPQYLLTAGGDNNMVKTEYSLLKNSVISGVKGEATPVSSPTPWAAGDPDLFEKWDVKTDGTYTNFKDASNNPIVVTTSDLNQKIVQIWVTNGVSKKEVTDLPSTDYNAGNLDPASINKAETGKSVSEYVGDRVSVQDALFTQGQVETAVKQPTATGSISNSGVGTVHGLSASIGIVPKTFDKITVSFAQNAATPITQIEVRLFQGKTVGGTLIAKKRQTFSASAGVQVSNVLQFDTKISYSGEMWIQVLMNNPWAYKRVSPATARTAANGYGQPYITTVNNLDGTTFATSQAYIDAFFEFNSFEDQISLTDKGKEVIGSSDSKIKVNKTWNCVGHSIWWQDGNVYSGTSNVAIGIQTLVKRIFQFNSYNKYAYSGYSLGGLTESDTASIASMFGTWTDTSDAFWTLDTITNDFKRNIPIGTINDYNNATGILTYYGALKAFFNKVQSLTPNAPVIAFNALRRNNGGYTSTSTNTAGHTLADYEKAIMTICSLNGWRFVDQFRQSEITDETLSITTMDGLHPNDFGYRLCVKPVIRNIWIYASEK
jgi:hypothetical protein